MANTKRGPWGPDEYLWSGVGGAIVGGIILAATIDNVPIIGFLALTVASTWFAVGVVAKGVSVGMRADRQAREKPAEPDSV